MRAAAARARLETAGNKAEKGTIWGWLALIFTLASLCCLVALLYFSMGSKPLHIAKELSGEFTVEALGLPPGLSSAMVKKMGIPKTISLNFTHEVKVDPLMREQVNDVLDLQSEITLFDHTIPAGSLKMARLRVTGHGWTWSGKCSNAELCTLTLHQKKFMFSALKSSTAAAAGRTLESYAFVATAPAEDSIFERKGKFVGLIVVVVVVLVKAREVLVPGAKRRQLNERMALLKRQQAALKKAN